MVTKFNHKPVSHFEQMRNRSLKRKVCVVRFPREVLTQKQVLDEATGRVIYQSEFVVKDNSATLSKFKVSDFTLENLNAIGATEKLKPVRLVNGVFENVSSLENSLENVSKSITSNQE